MIGTKQTGGASISAAERWACCANRGRCHLLEGHGGALVPVQPIENCTEPSLPAALGITSWPFEERVRIASRAGSNPTYESKSNSSVKYPPAHEGDKYRHGQGDLAVGLEVGVEQLGLHVLWAVGNSLQRQGFDAAGLKTTVHENNNHATPSSCP